MNNGQLTARLRSDWNSLAEAEDWPAVISSETLEKLILAYSASERTYHNLEHIASCLDLLQSNRDLAMEPAAVQTALWFHDAVYHSQASDNEEKSALWAAESLRGCGAPAGRILTVKNLILATKHSESPQQGQDLKLITDIDLAILGTDVDEFDHYDKNIRVEYSWVEENAYRTGRAGVLRAFLNRKTIYSTTRFLDRYEKRARENIARALARLQQPD